MGGYEPERYFKLKRGSADDGMELRTSSILQDYQEKFNRHGELSL